MRFASLVTFAFTHFLASASPGPNFFLISSLARSTSRRTALIAACGTCCSVLIWAASAAAGLSRILAALPAIAATITYAGAGYLVWVGLSMVRSGLRSWKPLPTAVVVESTALTGVDAARRGLLVGIGNPKTLAYYTSVFSLVVPSHASIGGSLAVVALAVAVSGLWWCVVAILFSLDAVSRRVAHAQSMLDVFGGGAFVAFGLGLWL